MFIVLEGLDGAGKTTQAVLLTERLRTANYQVLQVHEPGGTPLGERIRTLLKHEVETPMSASAELLLFAASRAQLIETVIKPALRNRMVVLADRFTASTYAYQGYGRGLPLKEIEAVQAVACDGLTPDLSVLLDITLTESTVRRQATPSSSVPLADRFEGEAAAFAERVRRGYLAIAAVPPPTTGQQWLVVDGGAPTEQVADRIWQVVSATLGAGNK